MRDDRNSIVWKGRHKTETSSDQLWQAWLNCRWIHGILREEASFLLNNDYYFLMMTLSFMPCLSIVTDIVSFASVPWLEFLSWHLRSLLSLLEHHIRFHLCCMRLSGLLCGIWDWKKINWKTDGKEWHRLGSKMIWFEDCIMLRDSYFRPFPYNDANCFLQTCAFIQVTKIVSKSFFSIPCIW